MSKTVVKYRELLVDGGIMFPSYLTEDEAWAAFIDALEKADLCFGGGTTVEGCESREFEA